jgi:prepilin-type N-terminal cleavage/methylation domain-containing protein
MPRRGFTLIEMIVVITIIIVLASLTIGALMKATDWMKRTTTENVMQKVHTIIDRKQKTCASEAKNWDVPPQILALAGGNQRRAKVIQRKFLLKWSFPQTYREAAYNVIESDSSSGSPFGYQPGGYPVANTIYRELRKQNGTIFPASVTLATLPAAPASAKQAAAESAACAAAIHNTYGSNDQLSGREIADTNGDGVQEAIDAWDTPIMMVRWPTGLRGLQSQPAVASPPAFTDRLAGYLNATTASVQDVDDPESLLYDPAWQTTTLVTFGYSAGGLTIAGTTTPAEEIEARFHPIRRNNMISPMLAPLTLISAGTDREFGLLPVPDPILSNYPPVGYPLVGYPRPLDRALLDLSNWGTSNANAPQEFDNLYSFRLRLGTR